MTNLHPLPIAPDAGDRATTCALEMTAVVDELFAPIAALGDRLAVLWAATTAQTGGRFVSADLVDLQPAIFELLDAQPSVDSGGFVFAEGVLADRPRYLEWWHRNGESSFQPLILETEVGSPDCYDYYRMDWFRAALDEQRRFVSGPLIDLPCAAVYVLTFSHPVVVAGTLLGIAGADVALSRYEDELVPPLLDIPEPAVLVTSARRVIVSNDPRWTTGEKLPLLPAAGAGGWAAVLPVTADLGWRLAVLAS